MHKNYTNNKCYKIIFQRKKCAILFTTNIESKQIAYNQYNKKY